MAAVFPFTKFDINSIDYNRITKSKKSVTTVYGNENFALQLGKLHLNGKLSPDLKKYDMIVDPTSDVFKFLLDLEDHHINTISEKSEALFGKVIPTDAVKDMYKSNLTTGKDHTTLRVALGEGIVAYRGKDSLDINDLEGNEVVTCILEHPGLWFRKTTCGSTLVLRGLKDHPVKKIKKHVYAFVDSDTEHNQVDEDEVASVYQEL